MRCVVGALVTFLTSRRVRNPRVSVKDIVWASLPMARSFTERHRHTHKAVLGVSMKMLWRTPPMGTRALGEEDRVHHPQAREEKPGKGEEVLNCG